MQSIYALHLPSYRKRSDVVDLASSAPPFPAARLGGNEDDLFLDALPDKLNLDLADDFGEVLAVGDLDCASIVFSPTIGIARFILRLLSSCLR